MIENKQILAHRGAWTDIDGNPIFDKNSPEAIQRASILGFGLETDIRDLNGEIVISHDPPKTGAQKIDEIDSLSFVGPLALNIKSDGLSALLRKKIADGIITGDYFFFDMSIPEEVRFAKDGIVFASRISEFETYISPRASWIWIDGFESDWFLENPEMLLEFAENRKLVVVSPELHGRPTDFAWSTIANLMNASHQVHLCTDYPEQFLAMFGGADAKS